MEEEIEKLANIIQGFCIDEKNDLLDGKVYSVLSIQRCRTIAETLIKIEGYHRPTPKVMDVKWPDKEILCPHQKVNPKQLCLACESNNDAIDDCRKAFDEANLKVLEINWPPKSQCCCENTMKTRRLCNACIENETIDKCRKAYEEAINANKLA